MNILEYIEDCMMHGMSESDAEFAASFEFDIYEPDCDEYEEEWW